MEILAIPCNSRIKLYMKYVGPAGHSASPRLPYNEVEEVRN